MTEQEWLDLPTEVKNTLKSCMYKELNGKKLKVNLEQFIKQPATNELLREIASFVRRWLRRWVPGDVMLDPYTELYLRGRSIPLKVTARLHSLYHSLDILLVFPDDREW